MQVQQITLSDAARVLRSKTATPDEKSNAARVLGKEGGKNSHNNDGKRN